MRRGVLISGLSIAFLCGGSVALIASRTGYAPPPQEEPAFAKTDAAPAMDPIVAAPAIAPTASSGARAPSSGHAAQPRTTGRASLEPSIPPPNRVLSKFLRRQLNAGSSELRTSLAQCARPGEPQRRPAVLMLELENLDGSVRILDAAIQTKGDASDAFVACAQGTLRNQVIAAPAARPGSRSRLPLTLTFF